MRLLLVTDAWEPQVNGVVRTLRTVVRELITDGHDVRVVHPQLFRTIPCPTYPEIALALLPKRKIGRLAEEFEPNAVHIATEGPLGLAARSYCKRRGWPFTTSFHTRFPEYVHERARIPTAWTYRAMRWFHGGADRVMVATASVQRELEERGFANTARWSRGVDTELFQPLPQDRCLFDLPRPIHVYVGRVAVEKNIEAFLSLDLEGSKVVVGDGPQRPELQRRHPDVLFTGAKHGAELARHYGSGDVFVFPSRTDTFGLVMLEALACGLPVAAYPVPGPLDVIGDAPQVGVLDEDLAEACRRARELDPADCRSYALGYSWRACAHQFEGHLAPFAA